MAGIRWINRCLIACIIVLSLAVWFISKTFGLTAWAWSGVKEMQANSFVVEDENGKTRAMLSALKYGPVLSLLDQNSIARAILGVCKDVPMLSLLDQNGKPRAVLGLPEDVAELTLGDENGKTRALLLAGNDGVALSLFDENGNEVWSAP